jgi:hypothetical protein
VTGARLALVVALATAALAAAAAPAGATNECRGLQVCIPVAGPWVAIPPAARTGPAPSTRYLLACPGKGRIVGGHDARGSDRAIDLAFLGMLGSPVNPGITTSDRAVFVGTYTGTARRPTAFRPLMGCIPTSGGGGRGTTAYTQARASPAGHPATWRAVSMPLRAGETRRATARCGRGERLAAATHAVGFYQGAPPEATVLASVRVQSTLAEGRVVVFASRRAGVAPNVPVEIQVTALCAA